MRLGIISAWDENAFINAKKKGLEFIECDVNSVPECVDDYAANVDNVKALTEKYGVDIGAIGRWGSHRVNDDGSLDERELGCSYTLIDCCEKLGCPVFICGCNYIQSRTFEQNCESAIEYFRKCVEYATPKGVKVCVYNCPSNNFVLDPTTWDVILPAVPGLGIKYDTSHTIKRGGDYMDETNRYAKFFYHVHIKGSVYVNGKRVDDPPAGLDQVNWGAFLAVLYKRNYNAGLSIEPHSKTWRGKLGEWGVDYTINYIRPMIYPGNYVEENASL